MAIERPSTKTCSACKQEKTVEAFHLSGRLPGQRRSRCILCIRAENKQWYEENTEQKLALAKAWREANADRFRALTKAWALANPERKSAKNKAWRAANPGLTKLYSKQCRLRHPEKNLEKAARYRARKHAAEGRGLTPADVAEIYRMQRGRCGYCKIKLGKSYERDHIMPLTKGGEHDKRNIQLLCERCNCSKHNRHPIDHARRLGLLL